MNAETFYTAAALAIGVPLSSDDMLARIHHMAKFVGFVENHKDVAPERRLPMIEASKAYPRGIITEYELWYRYCVEGVAPLDTHIKPT